MSSWLAVLLFGTLMPGSWKSAASSPFDPGLGLAVVAHVVLFAVICFSALHARFREVRSWHVLVLALVLAVATEGLQFFAIDRHPNLAGVGQDMVGAFLGWGLGSYAAARR